MRYDVPIFDPYLNRGEGYYHPGNDEALRLLHVQHAYRDIAILLNIARRLRNDHERALLGKFVIVELFSLDSHATRLSSMVLSGRTEFEVLEEKIEPLKLLYESYRAAWRPHRRNLEAVRNKMAAHRDPLTMTQIAELWDSVDMSCIIGILREVPPLHDYLKNLNIYKWTKAEMTEQGEIRAYIQPFDSATLRIPSRPQE